MFALDDVDKKLIKVPSAQRALLETFREGYKQGSKGVAYDGVLAFGKQASRLFYILMVCLI